MKLLKKLYNVCALVLVLTLVAPTVLPFMNEIKVSAATIKLSDKELALTIGESKTITITGSKTKVTWTSSKKSVATVDKTGKVTAINIGKALITATIGKKKLICKVTVNEPVSPVIANAPFEAQELLINDKIKCVIPTDMALDDQYEDFYGEERENGMLFASAPTVVEPIASYFIAIVTKNNRPIVDYYLLKENCKSQYTQIAIQSRLKPGNTVSYIVIEDIELKKGTAVKISFTITTENNSCVQTIYKLSTDNYFYEVSTIDFGDYVNINTVAEYFLDTIEVIEQP